MLEPEYAMVTAAVSRLRLSAAGFWKADDVISSMDHFAPPTAGQVSVVVMGGGWRTGPTHDTNAQSSDLYYGLDVAVVLRSSSTPRDRANQLAYGDSGKNVSTIISEVCKKLDFQYPYMNEVNAVLAAAPFSFSTSSLFVEPLRLEGIDKRSREAEATQMFSDDVDPRAAITRTVNFHKARIFRARTQA